MPACLPVGRRVRKRPAAAAVILAFALSASADYVVRSGDTLSHIAARHDVSVGSLASANGLADADRIVAGQRLSLPVQAAAPPAPAAGVRHHVRQGETLASIGARYRVSVADIVRANSIADPNRIHAGQQLMLPGGGQTVPVAASASRQEVGALLEQTARRYGWSPAFVKAVAWQESGWNSQVVSSAGAVGVMQVLPSTGRFVSQSLVGRNLDLHDPADNIEAGVAFLDYLYRLTGGDPEMVLGGYYQGLRSINQNGMYLDTEQYIRNVLALRARFR